VTFREKQLAMISDLFYERSTTDDVLWLRRLDDKIIELTAALRDK
jgi:hypothetical protein